MTDTPSDRSLGATDTVCYLRVSTEEQARDDRASLSQQREACTQLAGVVRRTVGAWFVDAGASGGSAKRSGFQALVAFCRAHPRKLMAPGFIFCLNHSRWGRFPDPNDATWWMQEMKHVGWHVRFAEGGGLEGTPVAPIMDAVQHTQATAYREALRANCVRGWRSTAAQGYWQNEAPFGYRREAIGLRGRRVLQIGQQKSKDERAKLVPGPDEEVTLVQFLFREYAKGAVGCDRLAHHAMARYREKKWSKQVVRHILTNPAYVGDVVWGRRETGPEGLSQRRDRAGWVTTSDAHPALITRTLFARVQQRLQANQKQTRLSTGGYPLSGLLVCAHCGDPMIGGGGPKGPEGDPDRYRMYRHASISNARPGQDSPALRCFARMATVPKRLVEPAVIVAIGDILGSSRFRLLLERACDRVLTRFTTKAEPHRNQLERRREKLLDERARLVKLASSGVLTEEEVAPPLHAMRDQLAVIDQELQRAQFAERRVDALGGLRAELLEQAAHFVSVATSASGPELRELIRPWIHSAVVDREQNVVKLAIAPLPIEAGFRLSTTGLGPDSRAEKEVVPLIRRILPLPPARSLRRKRLA